MFLGLLLINCTEWGAVSHALWRSRHSVGSFHVRTMWAFTNDWHAIWSSMYFSLPLFTFNGIFQELIARSYERKLICADLKFAFTWDEGYNKTLQRQLELRDDAKGLMVVKLNVFRSQWLEKPAVLQTRSLTWTISKTKKWPTGNLFVVQLVVFGNRWNL